MALHLRRRDICESILRRDQSRPLRLLATIAEAMFTAAGLVGACSTISGNIAERIARAPPAHPPGYPINSTAAAPPSTPTSGSGTSSRLSPVVAGGGTSRWRRRRTNRDARYKCTFIHRRQRSRYFLPVAASGCQRRISFCRG